MSFKRLLPLLDRVLVEKIAAPTKSAGGILLPEQAAAKSGVAPGMAEKRAAGRKAAGWTFSAWATPHPISSVIAPRRAGPLISCRRRRAPWRRWTACPPW